MSDILEPFRNAWENPTKIEIASVDGKPITPKLYAIRGRENGHIVFVHIFPHVEKLYHKLIEHDVEISKRAICYDRPEIYWEQGYIDSYRVYQVPEKFVGFEEYEIRNNELLSPVPVTGIKVFMLYDYEYGGDIMQLIETNDGHKFILDNLRKAGIKTIPYPYGSDE